MSDSKNTRRVLVPLNRGVEVVLAVGLIIIIIAVVLVFLFNRNLVLNNGNTENPTSFPIPVTSPNRGQIIPIANPGLVEVGNLSIELTNPWKISTIIQDYSQNIDYECSNVDQTLCRAYHIYNGQVTYFISTPASLRTKVTIPANREEKTIRISGVDYKFNYEKLELVIREGESEEAQEDTAKKIYKEVHGCLAENICVSSGILNTFDEEKNKEEVSNFENFLTSLKIS